MHTYLLRQIVEACNANGIPHMIAGSFASTFHSDPRMTRDIDIVIDPSATALAAFVQHFDSSRFYVSDAQSALTRRDMFNIIDTETGWSADLIIRKERAFSERELQRRQAVTLSGVETYVASVEDTILAKLDWAKDSESTRQFEDVVAMIQAQRNRIDIQYLEFGADELGVSEALDRALRSEEQ